MFRTLASVVSGRVQISLYKYCRLFEMNIRAKLTKLLKKCNLRNAKFLAIAMACTLGGILAIATPAVLADNSSSDTSSINSGEQQTQSHNQNPTTTFPQCPSQGKEAQCGPITQGQLPSGQGMTAQFRFMYETLELELGQRMSGFLLINNINAITAWEYDANMIEVTFFPHFTVRAVGAGETILALSANRMVGGPATISIPVVII